MDSPNPTKFIDAEDEEFEEAALLAIMGILLTKIKRYLSLRLPYNDLELTGALYPQAVLQGNPRRCQAIFRLPASTIYFLCEELLAIEIEPASKLVSIEEQLCIFLYIVGHKNSNNEAQDRFQHSGETISK